MQYERKAFEGALIDVEISNTHAIALGRRFFALQQEAERIRDEIACLRAERAAHSPVVVPTEDVSAASPSRARDALPRAELKSFLDSVSERGFVDGMVWSRAAGTALSLRGWAFLSVSEPPLVSVIVKAVGANSEARALAQRTIREDVADHFHRPDIVFCGFSAEISLDSIEGTSVELRIEARDGHDDAYEQSLGTVELAP